MGGRPPKGGCCDHIPAGHTGACCCSLTVSAQLVAPWKGSACFRPVGGLVVSVSYPMPEPRPGLYPPSPVVGIGATPGYCSALLLFLESCSLLSLGLVRWNRDSELEPSPPCHIFDGSKAIAHGCHEGASLKLASSNLSLSTSMVVAPGPVE